MKALYLVTIVDIMQTGSGQEITVEMEVGEERSFSAEANRAQILAKSFVVETRNERGEHRKMSDFVATKTQTVFMGRTLTL